MSPVSIKVTCQGVEARLGQTHLSLRFIVLRDLISNKYLGPVAGTWRRKRYKCMVLQPYQISDLLQISTYAFYLSDICTNISTYLWNDGRGM